MHRISPLLGVNRNFDIRIAIYVPPDRAIKFYYRDAHNCAIIRVYEYLALENRLTTQDRRS